MSSAAAEGPCSLPMCGVWHGRNGRPGALGGRVGVVETLVHHQDIWRALERPRPIPAERLLPALHTAPIAPDIGGLRPVHGIRLAATMVLAGSAEWGPVGVGVRNLRFRTQRSETLYANGEFCNIR